jgi:hypothetical protein
MTFERLKNATLPQTLSEVVADLANLFEKELQLAKAEISSKIATKLSAGLWISVAGIIGLMATFFVLLALVFGIASYGIAMHWACLIVAAGLAIIATIAFSKGRADARAALSPDRTIHQVKRDISMAKEQWT